MIEYNKEHPLRVFESFAGYGSQSIALERLKRKYPDFDYKVVGISEVEMNALAAYRAIHGNDIPNYGDISAIDPSLLPDVDLLTYSFPCQSISGAGKMKGLAEGSGTRSSLLWECRKIIKAKRPKYLLMENVKMLTSTRFMPYFQSWLNELADFDYINYWKVINAADMGVPQHRERTFCISILNDGSNQTFQFPKPFPLTKCLGDVLEDKVEDKFYLTDKALAYFKRVNTDTSHNHKFIPKKNETSPSQSDARQEAELTTTTMQKSNTNLAATYKRLLEENKIEIDLDQKQIIEELNAFDIGKSAEEVR